MGITQQTSAVGCIQEVVNLLLLRGQLGRKGAGVCPVRGHSNVQGDRTMGIFERPAKAFLDALQRTFQFDPPRNHGYDTVQAIRAMHEGRVGVFFAMGGNFLSATPDTTFTAEALRRTRLTAHVSTKLNRSHLITGQRALILPCLGRTETDHQASGDQIVSVENSMGVVHASTGNLSPGSDHLRSEVAIVAGLAQATLSAENDSPSKVDWKAWVANYDLIRDQVEQVVPGFEGYNRRLREGGFYLPHAVRDHLRFDTPSGKAEFTVHPIPKVALPEGGLVVPARNSWIIRPAYGHHVAGVWGEAPGLRAFASRSTPCVRYLEGSAPGGVTAPARLRDGAPEGLCPDDHRSRATPALPGGSAPRHHLVDPGISGEVH
jgi:molybdopterin-dependent oxidoreductase alpha subunit